jgi:asparaginyl-tRNA synthetase
VIWVTPSFSDAYYWTSATLSSLRGALDAHGFAEILPAILSERFEPGARHAVAVLGDHALPEIVQNGNGRGLEHVSVIGTQYYYLPVSHCVEKQLALEHTERVYCIAPCVRLLMEGEDKTGRHLYTFFQAEIEWRTERVEEVYDVIEELLADFAGSLRGRLECTGALDDSAAARLDALASVPYRRIPFTEARTAVQDAGGDVNPHAAGDLTHAEERALSEAASSPLWLTDYPEGVRDSLYRRTPSGTFATYDLLLPGGYGEVATGGLRPDSDTDIRRQAATFDRAPHPYYADWKARSSVQTGGLGFGVERLVRYVAGADSVLDLRFAHDQGPNARIGA